MVVRFVLQMVHFAVGVIDERALFGQTLYMLQYQSAWLLLCIFFLALFALSSDHVLWYDLSKHQISI